MNPAARKEFCAVMVLGAALVFCPRLQAEDSAATNRPASNRGRVPQLSSASKSPEAPPLPPAVKSPVEFFRDLLTMTAAERRDALTNRSPESQKVLLAKLREYAALDANERELRLQATELRWYLWPLMNTPATNRTTQLANIPAGQRLPVESRLKEWDHLPDEVRKELLDNEAVRKIFSEIQGLTAEQQNAMLQRMKPEQRTKLQEGIEKWNKLNEAQRRDLGDRFNQFFALTEKEREKALGTLSVQERHQIEKTLQTFGRLRAEDRMECIRSFEKFANLNLIQRQLFLKNAERWKKMTPNERQAWREVVSKVPSAISPGAMPPLPPDLPPLPLADHALKAPQPVATNGN